MPNLENRTRSVQGYVIPSVIYPRPNEALTGGHLAHIAWLYSGITYSTGAPPVVTTSLGGLLPIWTRRRRG